MTAQLRDMEENGLVNRKVYAEVPPRVEYSLTELGQSLKPILDAMWSWGEDYKEKCRHTFTTRMCEAGVNVKVIQDTLGHKDISTTLNIYTDVTKELRKSEFEGLDSYFKNEYNKVSV